MKIFILPMYKSQLSSLLNVVAFKEGLDGDYRMEKNEQKLEKNGVQKCKK